MDAVIFDLGGVVLGWEPERAFEQVVDAAQVPGLMERIGFHDWNRDNDARGSLLEAEDELVARFPADADAIRGYREHFAVSLTGMVPGTAAVIAELDATGVPLFALTNWSGQYFPVARARFGVLDRFRDIVVSGHEEIAKPDPRIFAIACERNGLDPARTLFIDDAAANVAAAQAFGLNTVAFTGADRLRADLVGLGLLGPAQHVTGPVYHLAVRTDWEDALATGRYPWSTRGLDHDREGFVHCSFAPQVAGVRAEFYGDLPDAGLVLLRLDADGLPFVVEDGYPHLFAELPVERAHPVELPGTAA